MKGLLPQCGRRRPPGRSCDGSSWHRPRHDRKDRGFRATRTRSAGHAPPWPLPPTAQHLLALPQLRQPSEKTLRAIKFCSECC